MSKLCPKCQYLTYLATPSPLAVRQVSSRQCVWGGYVRKQFRKGGHQLLLQNVTVHVGIHVSLNEPQLPSTSSTHAAPDHDATTTMLDCRQGTIFLVLLTRASPHMLDTIWVKRVYLQTHQTTGHGSSNSCSWPGCLKQSICRLFCEPASDEASFWDDGHANRLVAVYGLWTDKLPGELPSWRFMLQPQSNTPDPANQGVQGYLIITDRCVAAGLELKFAGL